MSMSRSAIATPGTCGGMRTGLVNLGRSIAMGACSSPATRRTSTRAPAAARQLRGRVTTGRGRSVRALERTPRAGDHARGHPTTAMRARRSSATAMRPPCAAPATFRLYRTISPRSAEPSPARLHEAGRNSIGRPAGGALPCRTCTSAHAESAAPGGACPPHRCGVSGAGRPRRIGCLVRVAGAASAGWGRLGSRRARRPGNRAPSIRWLLPPTRGGDQV